jgi:hypothetical protein
MLFGAPLNSLYVETRNCTKLSRSLLEWSIDWWQMDTCRFYVRISYFFNHPHYYEQNWKRNITHFGFSYNSVDDVTSYTDEWQNVQKRRDKDNKENKM